MKTVDIQLGNKLLKCRLGAKQIVQIENSLGKGMMELVMKNGQPTMPPVGEMLVVLQGAHTGANLKQKDMLDYYDEFMEAGKGYMELFDEFQKVLNDAGFFGKSEDEEKTDTDSSEDNEDENILEMKRDD